MYNINQIAELLNMESIRVHEYFLDHRLDLKKYTNKKNGVIEINEEGFEKIKIDLLKNKSKSMVYKGNKTKDENTKMNANKSKAYAFEPDNESRAMLERLEDLEIAIAEKTKKVVLIQEANKSLINNLKREEAKFLKHFMN